MSEWFYLVVICPCWAPLLTYWPRISGWFHICTVSHTRNMLVSLNSGRDVLGKCCRRASIPSRRLIQWHGCLNARRLNLARSNVRLLLGLHVTCLALICSYYYTRPVRQQQHGCVKEPVGTNGERCQVLLLSPWGCVCGRTACSHVVRPVCLGVSSSLGCIYYSSKSTRRNSGNDSCEEKADPRWTKDCPNGVACGHLTPNPDWIKVTGFSVWETWIQI